MVSGSRAWLRFFKFTLSQRPLIEFSFISSNPEISAFNFSCSSALVRYTPDLGCSSDVNVRRRFIIRGRDRLTIVRRLATGLGRSRPMTSTGDGEASRSSHRSQVGTPPGAEDATRSIDKDKIPPRTRSTKGILPSGLTEEEAEVGDYSDTDEDEAVHIPRVGDPPRPSGDKPPTIAQSRGKTSQG